MQNLIRGRGLFCRSLMKSQAASPAFTPVYAALVAVVNSKLPELGELLCNRLVAQVRRLLPWSRRCHDLSPGPGRPGALPLTLTRGTPAPLYALPAVHPVVAAQ